MGDVDGDGVPDFAVGAPGGFDVGWADVAGAVIVYSGRSSRELHRLTNGEVYDHFGWRLSGGFDVDGDGVGDLVVGAPEAAIEPGAGTRGSVFLYSAATGARLFRWDGSLGDHLGTTVSFVGDLDGDGVRDVAATADGPAAVSVYSSRSGALILQVPAPPWTGDFGTSIEDLGDVTGDGVSDLAIGAPFWDCPPQLEPRTVWIFNGATGLVHHLLALPWWCGAFGESLALIDDVDEDGRRDLAIASTDGRDADTLFVYSTVEYPTWSENLHRAVPLPWGVDGGRGLLAAVGDIEGTGDGYVAMGSPRAVWRAFYSGALALYSVAADAFTAVVEGVSRYEELGYSVSAIGDVNGDARPDVLVTAPGVEVGAQDQIPGGVAVYGFADLAPSRVVQATGDGKVNLASSLPLEVRVQGEPGSYTPAEVVAETVRLRGAVNVFHSLPSSAAEPLVSSDLDGDGTLEFRARFAKAGLREYFFFAHQLVDTVTVLIEADLRDGRRLQAPLLIAAETPPAAVARVIPNPVVGFGQLTFRTSRPGPVWLRVFDLGGRLVATLLSGERRGIGIHDVALGEGGGAPLSSGVYFYRLETIDGIAQGRFVLIQ